MGAARDDGGETGVDLAADLGNILNDPAFGDVVLVTQDHHRVFASTFILAARCKFFHGMLMNGTTLETRSSEISLPSITISALLPSLEFIYTGRLSKHALTIDNVIDVFHASRFFLLTHLHQLSLSFFSSQSLDQLHPYRAQLLSRAVEILSPTADTCIFGQLFSCITDGLWDTDNACDFSPEALQLYLKQTRNVGTGISTVEYLRLRFVLIWCAHCISVKAEEALKKLMPAQPLLSGSFEQKGDLLKVFNPSESLLKVSFGPWLHYLDLFQVHPHVLARVVEPMGIMSPIHLLNVFRFHAMFPNDESPLRWKEGAHPPSYVIQEGGCVLERAVHDEKRHGVAMAEELITSSNGVYEWDIVVERKGINLGIGFCSEKALKDVGSSRMWLGHRSDEWALWYNGHLYHNGIKKESYAHVVDADRVRVRVDLSKGTCSFTINETECGVAWNEIPPKIYPAVSLSFPGRVRLEAPYKEDKLRWLKPFE